jgi:AcrR family transcriptional regulator
MGMIQTQTSANETKQKIFDAAKTLFSQKGFDGASIRDIADTAGVNKSLVHYYFKSKNHILEELARAFLDETLKQIGSLRKNTQCE